MVLYILHGGGGIYLCKSFAYAKCISDMRKISNTKARLKSNQPWSVHQNTKNQCHQHLNYKSY